MEMKTLKMNKITKFKERMNLSKLNPTLRKEER
jgi:hypothetical protein